MSVTVHVTKNGDANYEISDGWTVVEGAPTMTSWREYVAPDGSIVAGTWRATPGTFYAESKYYEFVYLIEGKMELTPDGGETIKVQGGDAFSVEAGFKGNWKIIEPVYKRFLLKIK